MQPPSPADGLSALLAWCRHMRETQPIFYDQQLKNWNIFRYVDVQRVLSDPNTFSSEQLRALSHEPRDFLAGEDFAPLGPPPGPPDFAGHDRFAPIELQGHASFASLGMIPGPPDFAAGGNSAAQDPPMGPPDFAGGGEFVAMGPPTSGNRADLFTKGDISTLDPPLHQKLRSIILPAFMTQRIEQLVPRITAITHDLLDRVAAKGEMDLVHDFAHLLPTRVIAELLGIPDEDRERVIQWFDAMTSFNLRAPQNVEPHAEGATPSGAQVIEAMNNYWYRCCQERRRYPKDDVISRLVTAEIDGQPLDDSDVVGFIRFLLTAGHMTTTLLLGNAILCLDEHPEAMELLRATPSLIPSAIEEVLRCRPSFTVLLRVTTREVRLDHRLIPAGQMVLAWLISANYDEQIFPEPEHFDIQREPNRHFGFGRGIHFCLGAPLARVEARIALRILLERFPGLRRKPGSTAPPVDNGAFLGVKSLPVTW